MANEITVVTNLEVANLNLALSKKLSDQHDQATATHSWITQSIPTTAGGTVVAIHSSVVTLGYAFFRNHDSTNFVDVGVQVGGTFYGLLRLKAGEAQVFRLKPGVTVYALADTASVRLEHFVLND